MSVLATRKKAQKRYGRRAPLEEGRNWEVESHTHINILTRKRSGLDRSSCRCAVWPLLAVIREISVAVVNRMDGISVLFLGNPEESSSELEGHSNPCIHGGGNPRNGAASGIEGH